MEDGEAGLAAPSHPSRAGAQLCPSDLRRLQEEWKEHKLWSQI